MTTGPSERALQVAKQEARGLVEAGAEAVYLTGSHARGDAHPESDIDIRAIGEGSTPKLKRHDEFLISTSWQTREENDEIFEDPSEVAEVVPGWRGALILHDPNGVAEKLQQRARDWDWDEIAESADRWVAEQMTAYAEEVHTLIGNYDQAQYSGAAAIRSQLALHLAQYLAVHHHILYESENVLWDEVGKKMGDDYERNQNVALGIIETSLEDSCRAALDLFIAAVSDTHDLLDDIQRPVVDHALDLAKRPFPSK